MLESTQPRLPLCIKSTKIITLGRPSRGPQDSSFVLKHWRRILRNAFLTSWTLWCSAKCSNSLSPAIPVTKVGCDFNMFKKCPNNCLTKWLFLPLKESKNALSTKSRGLTQHMAYKNCLEKPFILYGPQVIMSCREKLERVWWVCVSCVRRHTQKGGNGRVTPNNTTCLEFLTIWKLFRGLERIFNNLRMQHITIHIALN